MPDKERRKPCDALAEALLSILASGDFGKRALPSSRCLRRGDFRRNSLDQADALVGCDQVFSAPAHIAGLDQPFNDRRACRRSTQRAVLHALAQFFVLNQPAGMLHFSED